ncbi:hypothetical protein Nepgr_001875 [Nepenthes gracilis]|uniref:Uncharacterized protein n=1 Tax=Nepenthes gracilis TaxID=150966 RepID=A0AAD3RXU0_NEPGR|nr:hypothetical protein Nepgr_001875 [Nepenthes gracilis]
MATTMRRPKWHPPPPPTPRILHLPRRTRRKQPTNETIQGPRRPRIGKLETLFDQERRFANSAPPLVLLNSGERGGRGSVVEESEEERESGGDGTLEEKWRFQAEILRAECKLLRIEREIVVKKSERERVFIEKTLKSAVHALISGKKKIREGKSVNAVFEEEIEELAKKLVELQRSSRLRDVGGLQNCSKFEKQASHLQKKLEKLGTFADEKCVKKIHKMEGKSSCIHGARDVVADELCVENIQEIERYSSSFHGAEDGGDGDPASNHKCNRFADVEILRGKMEGLSKGKFLKKMEEEFGSIMSTNDNCSVVNPSSTSRRFDLSDLPSASLRQSLQETKSVDFKGCSCHCKAIVTRIMEQVRAETEQWSQMQGMLEQVREEMEELQASQYFWEDRALDSDHKIQSLNSSVQEWKQKALSLEMRENQLQKQVKMLQEELETLRMRQGSEGMESKELGPVSSETSPYVKEKRVLTCRVKVNNQTSENGCTRKDGWTQGRKILHRSSSRLLSPNRLPFHDIGNLSLFNEAEQQKVGVATGDQL